MIASAEPNQVFWINDTLWNLYGDGRARLFDSHGLRLEHWRQQGLATLVKNGAGRTIYRVRLPGIDLYVKHFRATTFFNLLHQMIRQGRAEKEFRLAHMLRDAGVATIKPVAMGERWRNGLLFESYLLTEAIPNGITLFEWIERHVLTGRCNFPPSLRFRFAEELARLAANIHELGMEHRDLHEKNIIVQPDGHDDFRFYLLDLHELQIHRPLNWNRAKKELARMGRYFTLRTSRSDRYRFFRRYGEFRGLSRDEIRKLARQTESATVESRADFWRRRDTRPQRKALKVDDYDLPGVHALAIQELPADTVRELMKDPEAPFRENVVHWWKIGRATRVAEVDLPTIRHGESLIYKQYYFKGWHEAIAAAFRENQAGRAWRHGGSLLLRELPTPRPLMLIHKLVCGFPVTSYLLTERVPGALTMTRYLDKHLPDKSPAERRRIVNGVIAEAARLLRLMHDRRVTHRDLKSSNVLVSETNDLARPKLWLIDLDGVQTWQTVPRRFRIQNLTRFYVSFHQNQWITLTDRLRFLRLYLGRDFYSRDRSWKALWNEILLLTNRKIERNLRKGRTVV